MTRYKNLSLVLALLTTVALGCGGASDMPPLGTVTGTVTHDGSPVDGALVEFTPESGRPSLAVTDPTGTYELMYKADTPGAVVGPHTVSIRSERAASGGEGSEPLVEARKETIPQIYNDETILKVDVESGENTHNFDLKGERGPERRGPRNDA